MDEKTTDPAGKGPARRRLLRGTFAAPAVLTLVSGSALAATSLTCVAKLNLHPVNAGLNPAGNVWIRVPVWRKVNTNNGRHAHFVSGSQIVLLMPPGGSYISEGFWQCIKNTFASDGFTVGSTYTTDQVDTIKPNFPKEIVPNLFAAVRVDTTGKIVGVETISSANTAMSTSCWTSIGGKNPFA